MVKRKAKKTKKTTDPVVEDKLRQLKDLQNHLNDAFSEYETKLLGLVDEKVGRIKKLYADKLKSIPDNMRNMTITQIMEQQEKENCLTESSQKDDPIRSVIERTKMMSEKKKTLKKERKRSVTANSSIRPLGNRPPTNTFQRLSRTTSDPVLSTPLRPNGLSTMIVTPKFNPKYPVSNMARIPKPGELVMSLSGSPLQNVVTEGKVTLSLGGRKVLQLGEDTDLEKELKADMDDSLKKTFRNLKDQLDKILQA